MRQSGRIRTEKIVMLGGASTGKTSIVTRFSQDKFTGQSESTVGAAFITKTIDVDGKQVKLDIWDTGGSEKYRSLAPMYYRDARAAIITFDVTKRETLDEAREWLTELREHGLQDVMIVGAANKVDLTMERQLMPQEIEEFRFSNGIEKLFETSAKTGANIQTLFVETAKLLLSTGEVKDENTAILDDIGPSTGPARNNSGGCNC